MALQLRGSVPLSPLAPATSYWCHQCARAVSVSFADDVMCSHCGGGFVQAVEMADSLPDTQPILSSLPADIDHRRRNALQPLILLPNHQPGGTEAAGDRGYELYYDFGDGLGPRLLPSSISELLLGPGSEPILERITQMGFSMWARTENLPASKIAVAPLPTIEITSKHMESGLVCAVCKDEFIPGSEAREMPCNHIYHPDCIVPWLSHRNTCPVCRHELLAEDPYAIPGRPGEMALAIWKLPDGGIGVGRYMWGREAEPPPEVLRNWAVRELPREIRWSPRRRLHGLRRFFGNLGSDIVSRVVWCTSGGAPLRRSQRFSDSGTGSVCPLVRQD